MSDKPLDADLKALLDGIHAPDEAAEVVRDITAPRGAPKSLAEAAAAVADWTNTGPLQDRKYSTDVRPPLEAARRRASCYVLGVLAVAFVGIVGFRLTRKPPPIVLGDPIDFVAVLSPVAAGGPTVQPEWSIPRGASDSLTERGLSVRIGALLVEYERASARDDSSAQVFADAIAALVAAVPDGADAAAVFAAGGKEARAPEARRALAPYARAAPMALGGWVQAARVAASAADAGFFESRESKSGLAYLLALSGFTPEVETARDRLDTLLHRRGRPDFSAVGDALELIQRELAN